MDNEPLEKAELLNAFYLEGLEKSQAELSRAQEVMAAQQAEIHQLMDSYKRVGWELDTAKKKIEELELKIKSGGIEYD